MSKTQERFVIFAAGDDLLVLLGKALDLVAYRRYFPDRLFGIHGLGIPIRALKVGYLHENDFLSKNLIYCNDRIEVYRKPAKVNNSGVATRSISKWLTVA